MPTLKPLRLGSYQSWPAMGSCQSRSPPADGDCCRVKHRSIQTLAPFGWAGSIMQTQNTASTHVLAALKAPCTRQASLANTSCWLVTMVQHTAADSDVVTVSLRRTECQQIAEM